MKAALGTFLLSLPTPKLVCGWERTGGHEAPSKQSCFLATLRPDGRGVGRQRGTGRKEGVSQNPLGGDWKRNPHARVCRFQTERCAVQF